MAELLLMGMTHYPLLATTDDQMAALLRTMMKDPAVPAGALNPAHRSARWVCCFSKSPRRVQSRRDLGMG
jgi:hypothetical protein